MSQNPPPRCAGRVPDRRDSRIRIDIRHDYYPTDTSWQLTDKRGTVVASSEVGSVKKAQTLVSTFVDIIPGVVYMFRIDDSWGDGLLAGGYWEVTQTRADGTDARILARGGNGQFTSQSERFSLNPSGQPGRMPVSPKPSGQPSSMPSEEPSQSSQTPSEEPSQSSQKPSSNPSGQPTSMPSEEPSQSSQKPSSNPSGQPSSMPSEEPSQSSHTPSEQLS